MDDDRSSQTRWEIASSLDLRKVFEGAVEWAERNARDEHGHALSYRDHFRPMASVLTDPAKRIVVCAASQTAKTTTFFLKQALLLNAVPMSVINVWPREEDRNDFVQGRWNPMLAGSPWLRARAGQSVARVGLQEFRGDAGRSQVHFRGTYGRMSGIGPPADLLFLDEFDLCNAETIGALQGRTGASPFDIRWNNSNPSFPDVGVAAMLKLSDWKRWFVPCACGSWRDLLADWPECVDGEPPNARYVCQACGGEITDAMRIAGEWRPTRTEADGPITYSGYQISRLDLTLHSANRLMADIAEITANASIMRPQEVVSRFFLGRPHGVGGGEIARETLLEAVARWGGRQIENMSIEQGRALRLGVDVQQTKFVVVGMTGNRILFCREIPRTGETWSELDDLWLKLNPGYGIVDALPEAPQAAAFVARHKGSAGRVYYTEDPRPVTELRERVGEKHTYLVDRTASLDGVVEAVHREDFCLPALEGDVEVYVEQLGGDALRKVDVLDHRRDVDGVADHTQVAPRKQYICSNRKPHDFWHAHNYALLAQRAKRVVTDASIGVAAGGRTLRS